MHWNSISLGLGFHQLAASSSRGKMCEALNVRPTFKGVVISTALLATFLTSLAGSSQVVALPYCVYLQQSQELRCDCNNLHFNQTQPTVFPNNDFMVSGPTSVTSKVKEVAAVKLSGCEKLHLTLDLRPLPHPFYRLRIDNVPEVTINEIYLRPNDTVDLWFSGMHQNLTLKGAVHCPECQTQELDLHNLTALQKPQMKIHIVKSGAVMLDNFVKESSSSDLSFKVRDLDTLTIVDSYFGGLESSSLEIFNVPSVFLMHSEFHYCDSGFILANAYVNNITVVDSLLDDEAIQVLSNDTTKVTKKCSVSPLMHTGHNYDLGPDCENSVIGRWFATHGNDPSGSVETTGAITLALVSSAILMMVIIVLFSWHRQGKLDAYL